MPNTRSAAKQLRQNIRRRERNRAIKSATRTHVKRAKMVLEAGDLEQAPEALRLAQHALDKAAEKGVIHKNNAARHKARLAHRLNAIKAAAAEAAQQPEEAPKARRRTTTAKKTTSRAKK